MTLHLRRATLAACLIAAATGAAADASRETVRGQLAGRNDRFIELRSTMNGERFVAVSADRRVAFGDMGLEIRATDGTLAKSGSAAVLRYEFLKARAVVPVAANESPTIINWFVGPEANWRTNLKSFGEIAYREPWAGIDAVYSGDKSGIKYHFAVRAGANPKSVAFVVTGANDARITADGDVEWQVGDKRMLDQRPVSFQSRGGRDVVVPTQFTLEKLGEARWRLGFTVADYDKGQDLVIDPAIVAFSGLIGGNAGDQVYAITYDNLGNTYACGATASSDLITIPNAPSSGDNAFFAKLGPAGAPLVVTYLGGSDYDSCHGIALGTTGNIFLAGATKSTNFPFAGADASNRLRRSKAGSDRDAFVTKFNAAGSSIVYSGVMGGPEDDQANAIAVDASDRAYITGYSQCTTSVAACQSAFNPIAGPSGTHQGGIDAFVARINAAGSGADYSGYIGGNGALDSGLGIAVNASSEAYVVGETDSSIALPAAGAPFRSTVAIRPADPVDGFIARIGNTGTLSAFAILTGTQPSSTGVDRALSVAVNNDGTIVVVGETDSANFPANNAGTRLGTGPQNGLGGAMDGFVVRVSADLSSVLSATYIGGSGFDSAESVATDQQGGIYIAGTTSSASGFPTLADRGVITVKPGAQDGFIAKMLVSAPAVFQYSGYVGGGSNDALHAITVNLGRVAFVGGATTSASGQFTNPNTAGLSAGAASVNGLVVRLGPGVAGNDFNLDGFSDLLWKNTSDGSVQGWLMNGLAATQIAGLLPAGGYSVTHVADLDGDGKADLLISHTDGTMIGWLMNGLAVSGNATLSPPGSGWSVVKTGDLNGDGKADLIVQHTDGRVAAWIMNGLTVISTATLVPAGSGWSVAKIADLNGDGKADLVWQNTDGTVVAWLMDGTTATQVATFVGAGSGWSVARTGDFDGDGKADLLWQHTDGRTQAWIMNGLAATAVASFTPAGAGWTPVLAGDINGDGRDDLFWQHTNGASQTWIMNGTSVTSLATFVPAGTGWTASHLSDLNGDGKKDVLWKHTNGAVQAWLMNGLTITQLASLAPAGTYQVTPPAP